MADEAAEGVPVVDEGGQSHHDNGPVYNVSDTANIADTFSDIHAQAGHEAGLHHYIHHQQEQISAVQQHPHTVAGQSDLHEPEQHLAQVQQTLGVDDLVHHHHLQTEALLHGGTVHQHPHDPKHHEPSQLAAHLAQAEQHTHALLEHHHHGHARHEVHIHDPSSARHVPGTSLSHQQHPMDHTQPPQLEGQDHISVVKEQFAHEDDSASSSEFEGQQQASDQTSAKVKGSRSVLTLQQKLRIIREFQDLGSHKERVHFCAIKGRQLNVSAATLRKIVGKSKEAEKQRGQLEQALLRAGRVAGLATTLPGFKRTGVSEDGMRLGAQLEDGVAGRVYHDIDEHRQRGETLKISVKYLQKVGQDVADEMGIPAEKRPKFAPAWTTRIKKKYCLGDLKPMSLNFVNSALEKSKVAMAAASTAATSGAHTTNDNDSGEESFSIVPTQPERFKQDASAIAENGLAGNFQQHLVSSKVSKKKKRHKNGKDPVKPVADLCAWAQQLMLPKKQKLVQQASHQEVPGVQDTFGISPSDPSANPSALRSAQVSVGFPLAPAPHSHVPAQAVAQIGNATTFDQLPQLLDLQQHSDLSQFQPHQISGHVPTIGASPHIQAHQLAMGQSNQQHSTNHAQQHTHAHHAQQHASAVQIPQQMVHGLLHTQPQQSQMVYHPIPHQHVHPSQQVQQQHIPQHLQPYPHVQQQHFQQHQGQHQHMHLPSHHQQQPGSLHHQMHGQAHTGLPTAPGGFADGLQMQQHMQIAPAAPTMPVVGMEPHGQQQPHQQPSEIHVAPHMAHMG